MEDHQRGEVSEEDLIAPEEAKARERERGERAGEHLAGGDRDRDKGAVHQWRAKSISTHTLW